MSLLIDPIARFGQRSGRYARREPVRSRETETSEPLDAETLDLIQKFEGIYAELASPAAAPPEDAAQLDDFRIELPDDFQKTVQRGCQEPRMNARTAHSVQPVDLTGPPVAAANDRASEDEKLGIDQAFALLRAAESKGRAAADRDALGEDEAETAAAPRESLTALKSTSDARVMPFEPDAARADWAARARVVWPKMLCAAAIALIVGLGLGYVAGHGPKTAPTHTKIEVSPQGGAQLRFDYELDKR
jgi:hypothetical protein